MIKLSLWHNLVKMSDYSWNSIIFYINCAFFLIVVCIYAYFIHARRMNGESYFQTFRRIQRTVSRNIKSPENWSVASTEASSEQLAFLYLNDISYAGQQPQYHNDPREFLCSFADNCPKKVDPLLYAADLNNTTNFMNNYERRTVQYERFSNPDTDYIPIKVECDALPLQKINSSFSQTTASLDHLDVNPYDGLEKNHVFSQSMPSHCLREFDYKILLNLTENNIKAKGKGISIFQKKKSPLS